MSDDEGTVHGLLDTSTLILLGALGDASQLPEEPLISTITLAELSVGPCWQTRRRNARHARRTCSRRRPT